MDPLPSRRRPGLSSAAVGRLLVALGALFALEAAAADPSPPEARGLELFAGLRELLAHRCVGCHGAGSDGGGGGLDLSTRETLLAGGERGAAVVPGKSGESLLYRLAARLEEPHMPEEGDSLTADELSRLAAWIDHGAPYDRPLITDVDRTPWTERRIDPAAQERWPFRPLTAVSVPTPEDPQGWCRTPIDRFILARLRDAGLAPAAAADRRTLRRRLAADLTGLPATPAEIAAFIADPGADAERRVIDDLLDRKSYGEREAQHWLDVARYAESFGYEQDYDRPHAHQYRDFVVSAFNDDLPFDTFLRWQIAGDELAPDNPAARIATGFLAAGAFPTQLTEKEFESARSGEIDDMVSTIGTAMLGLTVGCARCHDHKFDPVPQADYYRFAATFTATVRSNVEIAIAPQRHAEAVAAWQAELDRAIAVRRRIEEEELPGRFSAWVASWQAEPDPAAAPVWRLGNVVSASSRAGTPLDGLPDGSFLAGGKPADGETYVFVIDVPLDTVSTLRLDALGDPSLPRGGPGRVAHGNFALSNISVTAAPIPTHGQTTEPRPVALAAPRADYSQPGLDVTQAIDASPTSGWAIDPHVGQAHVALFDFAEPVRHPGGCRLTVALDFRTSPHHAIGRPRISVAASTGLPPVPVTAEADPIDRAASERQRVGELVAKVDRTAAETDELRRFQAGHDTAWLEADKEVRRLEQARPIPETVTALVAGDRLQPIPHHADDRGYPHAYPETFFLRRGDVRQRDGVAAPGVLQVLSRGADVGGPSPPAAATEERPRTVMARWITDTESGAGALAARVIVNRIWQHHFGEGIVATPSDFGAQADPPSHPELLEWLAAELVRGGWRLKPIHRLIVSSATYRQASEASALAIVDDPRNRLLSHFSRRRLDAEAVRDALLAISGALDPAVGGRAGGDDMSPRRSIYLDVKRSRPSPFLRAFDAPDRVTGMAKRSVTTTAPQVLLLMNGPAVRGWAERFAARVIAEPYRFADEATPATLPIHTAYALALGRAPTAEEVADAESFLDGQQARYVADGHADAARAALADFCQVILSLNETLHVE